MKSKISVQSIQTEIFRHGQDLSSFLKKHLQNLSLEGKVLAITSKIVSLAENQVVSKSSVSKKDLIRKEADQYLVEGPHNVELTIKHGFLFASAGIDESNSENDDYILFPKKPYQSAEKIYRYLKTEFGLKNFGVILTDSHSMPFRRGVTGIALAHWGFHPTHSLIGQRDIFGRELKFTHVDVVDSLASMSVFSMGEANDTTPLALVEGMRLNFIDQNTANDIMIHPKDDLYYPLFKQFLEK